MYQIIHLSDIHFCLDSKNDTINYLIPALIKDLQKVLNKKKLVLLLISGDLVDRGGSGFDSLDIAFEEFETIFLNKLIEELKISKDFIFFVPGNHDINRDLDKDYVENGLANQLIDNNSLNTFLENTKSDTPGIKRIIPFYIFESKFKSESLHKLQTMFFSTYKINNESDNIGIICLNSSWRCYDSKVDKGNLLIGEEQLRKAVKQIKDCDTKILLSHHSIDYLKEFNMDIISSIIEKNIDMLFCGHKHKAKLWKNTGLYGNIFISLAPSYNSLHLSNDSINHRLGYNVISKNKEEIKVFHRHYVHIRNKFVPDTVIGDNTGSSLFILNHLNPKVDIVKDVGGTINFDDFQIINSCANKITSRNFKNIQSNLKQYFNGHRRVFDKDFPLSIFILDNDLYILASLESNKIYIYDYGNCSLNFDFFEMWLDMILIYQTIHSLSIRKPGNNSVYSKKSWKNCFSFLNKLYSKTSDFFSIADSNNIILIRKLKIIKIQIDNAESLFYQLTDYSQDINHNIIISVEMALSNFHKMLKENPLSNYLD